jgi:ketosteroid isomerase-like protein
VALLWRVVSQENVDLMREGIDGMNRRDLEHVLRTFHPEVRFEHRLAALQGRFVGIEGVKGWHEDLADSFDTWHIDCPDIRDLGDRVLALGSLRATGRESGVETEMPFTVVARIKDGLAIEFTDSGDREQALSAVGLSE